MVTVTMHVQWYNVCCGCLFDEQLHKSWTFLQIPSETLQIGHRLFRRFLHVSSPIPSSSMTDLALSCDKYAALINYATVLSRLQCVHNCGDVINTSSSLFLTDGVVTPIALSRLKDLTINSACRGSGSYSIQFLPPSDFQRTYRFRIRTSLESFATCTKNCSNFYRVMITHRTFNFAQRFTVTQGYEVISVHHHRCIKFLAM